MCVSLLAVEENIHVELWLQKQKDSVKYLVHTRPYSFIKRPLWEHNLAS